MKPFIVLLSFFCVLLIGCKDYSQKEKELALKEKELELREKELEAKKNETKTSVTKAKFNLAKAAEQQFEAYLPKLIDDDDNTIDLQEVHTGDFTGDGIEDAVIYYSLVSKGGGNAIRGQGLVLYKNTGTAVKRIGDYQPEYAFTFHEIKNGKIHVNKIKYAKGDPHCCPSIKTNYTLTIQENKIY